MVYGGRCYAVKGEAAEVSRGWTVLYPVVGCKAPLKGSNKGAE